MSYLGVDMSHAPALRHFEFFRSPHRARPVRRADLDFIRLLSAVSGFAGRWLGAARARTSARALHKLPTASRRCVSVTSYLRMAGVFPYSSQALRDIYGVNPGAQRETSVQARARGHPS